MGKLFITEIKGEAFPHRTLWHCAKIQFKKARQVKKGAFYFDLCAILMAYLAYEAYINFIGEKLDPDAWKNEKEFFNQKEHYGIEGKLTRIREVSNNFAVDKGKRPYQTIKKLGKFRTEIVHAKPRKYEKCIKHPDSPEKEDFWPEDPFPYVTEEQAKRVMQDVESFVEYLHQQIKSSHNSIRIGNKALTGMSGFAESYTKIAE